MIYYIRRINNDILIDDFICFLFITILATCRHSCVSLLITAYLSTSLSVMRSGHCSDKYRVLITTIYKQLRELSL